MTKSRKGILSAIMCLVMLLIGVCALTACGSKDGSATVKFMVQNENGVWTEYASVEAKDGKVELPQSPEKANYVFRDWYDYSGEPKTFDKDNVRGNKVAYAYFVPATVKISLNGNESEQTKLTQLEALTWEYTSKALAEGLSFDGWYTNSGYTEKYVEGVDATELYGRYKAHIEFYNGYETLYTADVTVGSQLSVPTDVIDSDSDGNPVTFEQKYIAQYYMDADTISYVCNGVDVDFTKAVSSNMQITVRWQTPYLNYSKDSDTGNYYVNYVDNSHSSETATYPVVSILSSGAVVNKSGSGDSLKLTRGTVNGVAYDSLVSSYSGAKKFIFEEGIEYIVSFNGTEACALEEVQLPSTLKVLERSFNLMPKLTGVTLPSKLVSVLDCFWADYKTVGNRAGRISEKTYNFNISIPDSVTNIVSLPENVMFSSKSAFVRDENDKRIYKINGSSKTLVTEYMSNVENGVLSVPQDVTTLQVGVFSDITCDILKIPSKTTKIDYNISVSVVPGYEGAMAYNNSLLYRPGKISSLAEKNYGSTGAGWFAVVDSIGNGIGRVEFEATSRPRNFKDYSIVNSSSAYDVKSYVDMNGFFVVFTKEIAANKAVTLNIYASNEQNGFELTKADKTLKSGERLTRKKLIELIGNEGLNDAFVITSVTELNGEYDFDSIVNRNLYLNVTIEYAKYGITTKENADGTLTVTGFDKENAQKISETEELYVVNIPASINGKTVVEIAESAFEGNEYIAKVFIKNSVKKIGAKAFKDTTNLSLVKIQAGGLETVGSYAFGGAGSYFDSSKNTYVKNQKLEIYLPLSNMKEIAPYAFKTPAIESFTMAEGESDRYLLGYPSSDNFVYQGLENGMFFFVHDNNGYNYGIIKYVSKSTEQKTDAAGDVTVNVYDVQYIATAGGVMTGSSAFAIGCSYRNWASYYPVVNYHVMRYEMMEGSVYYLNYHSTNNGDPDDNRSFNEITFGIVKKIHTNAFTDMIIDRFAYYSTDMDTWITKDDIANQNSSIFEEGWWQGISNSAMKDKLADIEKYTNSTLG